MNCGMGMIKYLLFIFNFIFAICGLGILATSIVLHLRLMEIANDPSISYIKTASITLIVVGSIIFGISFFGCCGAIRESHCMTITFASCLLFILIVQVFIGVFAFVFIRNIEQHVNIAHIYQEMFDNSFTNEKQAEAVTAVQLALKCCGVTSKDDYAKHNSPIPGSCCGQVDVQATCPASNIYSEGCVPAIKDTLMSVGNVLGGVAIGIAGVEIIGIVFALCLANAIKNAERRAYRV